MVNKFQRLLGAIAACRQCWLHQHEIRTPRLLCTLSALSQKCEQSIDLVEFPPEKVRNFGIIAHVDHGKSTIADRFLEVTGAISKSNQNNQVLDRLQVEREKGITVKAQTASIVYKHKNVEYLLNLIDTPGHVDFAYEVSRSLSACQGVLLVVDAAQGIQAQTLANFYLALEHELEIVPVINKIDLKTADVVGVKHEMKKVLGIDGDDVICVSAKHGLNIDLVLQAIVTRLPSPIQAHPESYDSNSRLQALLFDSVFERYRGVIVNLHLVNGTVRKGDRITTHWLQTRADKGKKFYDVKEVGLLQPDYSPTDVLYAGQVGYIICGMKNTAEAQIGDTIYHLDSPVAPMPGFKKAKPVVFGCLYPVDQTEHKSLGAALNRLALNDRSVTIQPANSAVLGAGFRIGFLGLLHMDVFQQRLEQEHDATVVVTSPNVMYKALLKPNKKKSIKEPKEVVISMPSDFPEKMDVQDYFQPMIIATIITPSQYENAVSNLCTERDGVHISTTTISESRLVIQYRMPMSEIMVDFYDKLKSISSGYASFDYDDAGYESIALQKLEFRLNGSPVDELSIICPAHKARYLGARMCERLHTLLPKQVYPLAIQALIGKNVIARETLPAIKKDLLVKCSGGDYTRKLKLLRKHAKHQNSLRESSVINIPKNLFIDILK